MGSRDEDASSVPPSLEPSQEQLLPWLAAAALVAAVTLVAVIVGDVQLASVEMGGLLVALCATLAVAELVAVRSRATVEEAERMERARPARDELIDLDAAEGADDGGSYVEGMDRWSSALLELLEHAGEATTDPAVRTELASAAEDTSAFRSLLRTRRGQELNLNEAATLHAVGALWETEVERLERMAADVDPSWHRRWRARFVVERLLRHGRRRRADLVLPYRS